MDKWLFVMSILKLLLKVVVCFSLLSSLAIAHPNSFPKTNEQQRISASELERQRLTAIIKSLDHMLKLVNVAQQTGASGRISFNYEALRRDIISRRMMIQEYINGSWSAPRGSQPLSRSYIRK